MAADDTLPLSETSRKEPQTRTDGWGFSTPATSAKPETAAPAAAASTLQESASLPDLKNTPKWRDIVSTEKFRALPVEEKTKLKASYFDDFIAPHAGEEAPRAKQEFMQRDFGETADVKDRTMLGAAGDAVRDAAGAVLKIGPTAVKGAADIYDMAAGNETSNAVSRAMSRGMEAIENTVESEHMRSQRQGFQEVMEDDAKGVGDMFAYLLDNPALLLSEGVTTLGSMYLPAGTAKAAGTAAKALGASSGTSVKAALAAVMGTTAAQNAADTFKSLEGQSLEDRYKGAQLSAAISMLTGIATRGGAEGQVAARLVNDMKSGRAGVEAAKQFFWSLSRESLQEMGEEAGNIAGQIYGGGDVPSPDAAAKQVAFAGTLGAIVGGGTDAAMNVIDRAAPSNGANPDAGVGAPASYPVIPPSPAPEHPSVQAAETVLREMAAEAGIPEDVVLPEKTELRTVQPGESIPVTPAPVYSSMDEIPDNELVEFAQLRRDQLRQKRDGMIDVVQTEAGLVDNRIPGAGLSEIEAMELDLLESSSRDVRALRSYYAFDVEQSSIPDKAESEPVDVLQAGAADVAAAAIAEAMPGEHEALEVTDEQVVSEGTDESMASLPEDITARANEAATSPQNDLPEPTEAQKEAGNYRKGHVRFAGLDLTIENPIGSTRSGKGPNGEEWSVDMTAHYGYIKRTTGADGEQIDVYLAEDPDPEALPWVFHQYNLDGTYDEDKVVLGARTEEQAKAIYDAHFSDGTGPQRRVGARSFRMEDFKEWLQAGPVKLPDLKGNRSRKPRTEKERNQQQDYAGKWFGSQGAADTFIRNKRIEGTHEALPNGRRFEIRRKRQGGAPDEAGRREFDFGTGPITVTAREMFSRAQYREIYGTDGGIVSFQLTGDGVDSETGFKSVAGVTYAGEMNAERLGEMMQGLARQHAKKAGSGHERTAKAEPAGADTQFANNKVFTADKVSAARERIRSKLSQLNAGIDPEMLQDGITIAGAYIESGVRSFSEFTKAMVADFGTQIRPFLRSFYEGVRYYPDFDTAGMTSAAEIDLMLQDGKIAVQSGPATATPATEDTPDAGTSQPRDVSAGNPETDSSDGQPVAGDREPLAAGLAGEGAGPTVDGPVSGRAESADEPGIRITESAGAGSPVVVGESGSDGAGSVAAVSADEKQPRAGRKQRSRNATGRSEPDLFADPTTAGDADSDHVIDAGTIGKGGLAQKYRDNVAAIRLLKSLESENRAATPEERKTLAKYVGWGALKGPFDPANKQWAKQHAELKELLSEQEFAAARRSTLDAHFTSPIAVKAMYDALRRLGFTGGRLLEPSVGVGNFLGLMPSDMRRNTQVHGVELDSLTSRLVAALYPSAKIAKATGFQDFDIPAEFFDVVIGNPPFGNQPLVDMERSEYSGFSIHNYFLAKSIDKLRPGGLLQVVVSRYFLDAQDSRARDWIAERAKLIGAVRLPNTAFKENAGTEVVTDILIFQKKDEHAADEIGAWRTVKLQQNLNPKTGDYADHRVNELFVNHPELVLGKPQASGSMYTADEYTVEPTGDIGDQLAAWVKALPAQVFSNIDRRSDRALVDLAIPDGLKVGSFYIDASGKIMQRDADVMGDKRAIQWTPPNQAAIDRMKGMIQLRDLLRAQMRMERDPEASEDAIESNRTALKKTYDAFVKKFGFLNSPTNRRVFFDDTEAPLVLALEFDYDTGISKATAEREGIEPKEPRATPADILTRRVAYPPQDYFAVETAKDALLASLNYRGRFDSAYMEEVYGKGIAEIVEELGDLVYQDPEHGYVTADEYLSGDVKTKVQEAQEAAQRDPAFQRNVAALEKVIPKDKKPSEISVSIGAAFVPAEIYEEFALHITGTRPAMAYISATGQWIAHFEGQGDPALTVGRFGTEHLNSKTLFNLLLLGKGAVVKETVKTPGGGTTTYVLEIETEAAREKQNTIKAEWQKWLWSEPARADRIATLYNEKMNRIVVREFNGEHMTFPGMNPAITLLRHQKNGVWRGLQSFQVLYDHVVGAGKTFEMAALAMEMKRLGIARKPGFAVPNHLTLQWRSEINRLYPGARVLAAVPSDFSKENREKLFSKIITGDWDAVVIGHSSLKKIGLPMATEMAVLEEQASEIGDAIEAMKRDRGDRNIIRDMEKIRSNLQSKLKERLAAVGSRSKVVTFDELGLDALFVDEMHEFKNLAYMSTMDRTPGMGNPAGSAKAFDLFVKVRWLFDTFGEKAPLITATGTPVSNSLVEMYNMQRYMQYPTLKAMGLHVFDAWAKQFGNIENIYEVAPSGSGYRQSTRFSKFTNLPALMSLYNSFADTVTLDDLKAQEVALGRKFPVPKITGGKPTNIVADRSPTVAEFMGVPRAEIDDDGAVVFDLDPEVAKIEQSAESGKWIIKAGNVYVGNLETEQDARLKLVEQALSPRVAPDPESILGQFANLRELTRSTKGKINALSLTNLANKAGLDYRLIDAAAPDFSGSKINLAVDRMWEIYQKWTADRGTQLVFCDLSIPNSARASYATKPHKLYVRNSSDQLEVKSGTMHVVEGFEYLPFFVVKRGAKEDARFSVYDAKSGQLVGDDYRSKEQAIGDVHERLSSDAGLEAWTQMRNTGIDITQDEIDEYNNENGVELTETSGYLMMDDVEGAASSGKFSVYDDIKAKLIRKGVPEAEIAFIHDYNTPVSKDKLFKSVKEGRVRFLLGSTPKMGAGTNVQDRLVGLHHIDAPWRPSDLEQREGRIIRRGNMFYARDPEGFEVFIGRYATAQTYDTRRWQILEHKARGIEQLRNYDGTTTEIDDIDGEAANAADMKAAASGDPLILEETKLRNEVRRLERLQVAHADEVLSMVRRAREAKDYVDRKGPERLALYERMVKIAADNPADEKGWAAPKVAMYKHAADKDAVYKAVSDAFERVKAHISDRMDVSYRGFTFAFEHVGTQRVAVVLPHELGTHSIYGSNENFSPTGFVQRLKNFVEGLPANVDAVRSRINKLQEEHAALLEQSKEPFAQEADLEDARRQHQAVRRALMAKGPEVPPEQKALVDGAIENRKKLLRDLGYGEAIDEMFRAGNNAASLREPADRDYGDPYRNFTTRPGTTEGQKSEGRNALKALFRRLRTGGASERLPIADRAAGDRIQPGDGYRVLGRRLPAELSVGKVGTLVGAVVASPHDLAVLAQVYRDPRFETFRVIFTDGRRIVGESGYSSRLPASVAVPEQLAAFIRQGKDRFRADGYYLIHNHPSGRASPSVEDERETRRIAARAPGFLGHVVIDFNEYAVINGKGASQLVSAPELGAIDFASTPSDPHPILGKLVKTGADVARIGKEVQVQGAHATLVMLDASSRVQLLVDIPVGVLGDTSRKGITIGKAAVRKMARDSGSGGNRFLVLPAGADVNAFIPWLDAGVFRDVVTEAGASAARNHPERSASDFMETGASRVVSEGRDEQVMFEARDDDYDEEAGRVFYSGTLRAARSLKQERGTPAQMLALLKKQPGVKQAELDWLGLDDYVNSLGNSVTRQQIVNFIEANEVQVKDVVLGEGNRPQLPEGWTVGEEDGEFIVRDEYGDEMGIGNTEAEAIENSMDPDELADNPDTAGFTKYANYQLPGGSNYKELLLTLPPKVKPRTELGGEPRELSIEEAANETGAHEDMFGEEGDTVLIYPNGSFITKKAGGGYYLIVEQTEGTYDTLEEAEKTLAGAWPEQVDRGNFRSSHFNEANIVAHVRFNERTDAGGNRVLFIEELQSDWAQQGRKYGFTQPLTDGEKQRLNDVRTKLGMNLRKVDYLGFENASEAAKAIREHDDWVQRWDVDDQDVVQLGNEYRALAERDRDVTTVVPPMPFKNTDDWAMLAFKRMVRYAAENGFDRIAWTTGAQQNERYDLSKHIDALHYKKNSKGSYDLTLIKKKSQLGDFDNRFKDIPESKLPEVIGKELAEKITAGEGKPLADLGYQDATNGRGFVPAEGREISGLDLKVGGEGMRGFYDKILPAAVNKWAKKFGGKVEQVTIQTGEDTKAFREAQRTGDSEAIAAALGGHSQQPSLTITDAMRSDAKRGMSLFERVDREYDPGGGFGRKAQRVFTEWMQRTPDNLRTFGLYDKSLATQYHKALKDRHFAQVFSLSVALQNEISTISIRPAEKAPGLLPKVDNVRAAAAQLVHGRKGGDTITKVAHAVFAGTLAGENVMEGTIWTDPQLRDKFGLDDVGVTLYNQARAAIDTSLDELAAAEAFAAARGYVPPSMRPRIISNPGKAREILTAALEKQAAVLERALANAMRGGNDYAIESLAFAKNQYEKTRDNVNAIFTTVDNLKEAGYAPLMRFGRYSVTVQEIDPETGAPVEGENGRPLIVFHAKYETEREAKAAARRFEKLYADDPGKLVRAGTDSELGHELYTGISPETIALFSQSTGVDLQEYYRLALAERSALKRRIERSGAPGFSRDLPRVLANFITSNARHAARQYYLMDISNAIRKIPQKKGDVKDEAIKLKKFMLDPSDRGATASSIMFVWFLGGAIDSAIVNITQPYVATFPHLTQFTSPKKAWKAMSSAAPFALGRKEITDKALRDALVRAGQEGIVDAQEVFHLYSIGSQNVSAIMANALSNLPGIGKKIKAQEEDVRARVNAFLAIWGSMFAAAEKFNRRLTFIAAWNVAKARNMRNPYSFAVRAVNETQGIYNKVNRPNLARSGVGRVVLTFKQFTIFMMEKMARQALKHGPEGRRALMLFLALIMLAAGEEGLPFMQDINDLIDTIGQLLGYNTNMVRTKRRAAHDMLGETLGDLFLYGASSALPLDFHGRLGFGNLIPGTSMLKPSSEELRGSEVADVFGPAVGIAEQVVDAYDAAAEGNTMQALMNLSPRAVKNVAAGLDMAVSGYARDTRGRRTVDVGLADALVKSIGFTPTVVAENSRRTGPIYQDIALQKKTETSIIDEWARGAVASDNEMVMSAQERLADWNRRNPETPIVVTPAQIRGRVETLTSGKDDRILRMTPREMRGEVGLDLVD